jgi:diguanylate cyclase (GGDEF)-like protein
MDIRQLQQKNQQLERMLNTAVNEAKLNEDVLKRFIDIEVKMLGCTKLTELISLLLTDFKTTFKLNIVTIFLHNKDDLAAPLLSALDKNIAQHLTIFEDSHEISTLFPQKKFIAGEIERPLRKLIFPNNPFVLSSVILPLKNKGQIIGSLHLGSKELNRYHSEYRYDYLERMSALLAVCIENCIIRENLDYLSSTDTLTKTFNRHSFDIEINKAIQRASRHKNCLSLLFLDIDHFKQVNDKYGHPIGDAVLKLFANVLKSQIRNTDFLARFGGEEFAILLPDCSLKQAEQIANNIRSKIEQQLFTVTGKATLSITTSVGVSCHNTSGLSDNNFEALSHNLLQSADDALYQAKHSGRNKVIYKAMSVQ